MNEDELKELARQLSCPEGENGKKTGEIMADSNANMTLQTIQTIAPENGHRILEIGFGNGSHIHRILDAAPDCRYYGIDISSSMVEEAGQHNLEAVQAEKVAFSLADGQTLSFEDNFFDRIFTVNTVYFWENPEQYAREIFRVLKPGGFFCLTFAPKEFMEKLPFTQYGFRLYTLNEASALLSGSSFSLHDPIKHTEETYSKTGNMPVSRDFYVLKASK